jgi:prepilin-type processing-associated H-X9-DG protein
MLNDDPGGANSSNPFSSGSKGIGDHIEPVTYNGSCDSMQQGSWPGLPSTQEIPRRLVEIRQPYCFPLLTETKPRSGTYGCWRWASVLQSGQAGADPSWRRHYGGTNPNSNGSNWLFADGHVAWHSASYASKKLICCMDFGSQYNDRFTQYQSLRTAKQAICQ